MKLFVGNLPWAATEESLKNFFEQLGGKVLSVKIIIDPYTGKSRGFGFVEMENAEQGNEALAKLNEVVFLDRSIRVSPARQEGQQGGGGGGGNGGPRSSHRPRRDSPRREGGGGGYGRSSHESSGYNKYHSDEE